MLADLGIEGGCKGADHGPAELIGQLSRAGAAIIKEGDAAETTSGQGSFSHDPGVTTGSKQKQSSHQLASEAAADPVNGAMVASPAALMPSRRITFQMVTRKMRRSSQKLW